MPEEDKEIANMVNELKSGKFLAAVDMIGRCGSSSFQIRYSDEDQPIAWICIAEIRTPDGTYYDCAGAMNPERAALRLAELLVDGNTCTHCKKPSALDPDRIEPMELDRFICWYQYDPELKTFRRSCEGD